METFSCFTDVYDRLNEIRSRYTNRAMFCTLEMNKLNTLLNIGAISESSFYQRMCPLLNEKRKVNMQYKNEIYEFLKFVPPQFYIVEVMSYYDEDVI